MASTRQFSEIRPRPSFRTRREWVHRNTETGVDTKCERLPARCRKVSDGGGSETRSAPERRGSAAAIHWLIAALLFPIMLIVITLLRPSS
jgi:hypothetical protein